jgi:hypothetical protein
VAIPSTKTKPNPTAFESDRPGIRFWFYPFVCKSSELVSSYREWETVLYGVVSINTIIIETGTLDVINKWK